MVFNDRRENNYLRTMRLEATLGSSACWKTMVKPAFSMYSIFSDKRKVSWKCALQWRHCTRQALLQEGFIELTRTPVLGQAISRRTEANAILNPLILMMASSEACNSQPPVDHGGQISRKASLPSEVLVERMKFVGAGANTLPPSFSQLLGSCTFDKIKVTRPSGSA